MAAAMSRPHRHFPVGTTAHIYQRGSNGAAVFADPTDFLVFLDLVREHTRATGVRIHAFGVLNTHYHLLATPDKPDAISQAMHRIDGAYARHFNRTRSRYGPVWSGRYRAKVIHSERYWLTVLRYIELNPVAAGIVECAGNYPWSSFRVHATGEATWLADHPVYDALGATAEERQAKYRLACASGVPANFALP